jgi:Dihaem cytochrome c
MMALLFLGCQHSLPERDSAAAALYAARCGSCHRAYAPGSLTSAMWTMQVAAMQKRIAAAGQPPLSADEQRTILDYLRRNAEDR